LFAQAAVAADNTCEKNFGLDVAYCAQTIQNTQFSTPKERVDWQKACVDQAKINKMVCESGGPPPPTCTEQCQIQYDTNALLCRQQYDPTICGGSVSCEQAVLLNQAACLSQALTVFNTCVAACPVQ